jgi:hypothetical protein
MAPFRNFGRNTFRKCKESLLKERINTIDLRVLTSSDELLFIMKLYFFFTKTTYLNEVNCTEPPFSKGFLVNVYHGDNVDYLQLRRCHTQEGHLSRAPFYL